MAMPYSNLASYATIVELYFSEIRLHYLKFVYDIHWLQINFFCQSDCVILRWKFSLLVRAMMHGIIHQ